MTTVRKFLVAFAGFLAVALSQGLLDGTAEQWAAVILSALTAAGVYQVPNESTSDA